MNNKPRMFHNEKNKNERNKTKKPSISVFGESDNKLKRLETNKKSFVLAQKFWSLEEKINCGYLRKISTFIGLSLMYGIH
jgi:hypothetical protein